MKRLAETIAEEAGGNYVCLMVYDRPNGTVYAQTRTKNLTEHTKDRRKPGLQHNFSRTTLKKLKGNWMTKDIVEKLETFISTSGVTPDYNSPVYSLMCDVLPPFRHGAVDGWRWVLIPAQLNPELDNFRPV